MMPKQLNKVNKYDYILNRGISKRLFSRQFGRHRSTEALFPLHVSYLACIFIRSAKKSVQRWGR